MFINNILGKPVVLVEEKIKEYKRFTLYQVYKVINGKRIPIYKTCKSGGEEQ